MTALYVNYQNLLLAPSVGVHAAPDWVTDDIDFLLLDGADYTPNLTTHQDIADIPSGAIVARETIASLAVAAGAADAADLTLPTVTGDQCELVVWAFNTGVDSTSTLLVVIDDFPAGMPVTPNGGDIDIVFDAAGLIGF